MATKKVSKVKDKNLLILEKLRSLNNSKLFIWWILPQVEYVSSGLMSFDFMTWWWIPKGKVVELYWPSWSWKTSFGMMIANQFSISGERVLFMDTEWTYPKYLEEIYGIENIDVYNATTWEEAVDFMVEAAGLGYWLIILDSVAMTVPMSMQNNAVESSNLGNMWKLMTKFMRLIVDKLRDNNCTLICINHEKTAIWWYNGEVYRPWWTAIPYASSLSIRIAWGKSKDDQAIDTKTGKTVYVKSRLVIQKTKLKKLHSKEITLYLDVKGRFSVPVDLINLWLRFGIITASWSWWWYKYNDISLGQGVLHIRNSIQRLPWLFDIIREEVLDRCEIEDKSEDIIFADDVDWYNKLVEVYNKKYWRELELQEKIEATDDIT